TTDAGSRRYRFSYQPAIAQWNLVRLANAIYPLIEEAEPLEELLGDFEAQYASGWQAMMASKLGLAGYRPADATLIGELDGVLQLAETDMTIFFRRLANLELGDTSAGGDELLEPLLDAFYVPEQLTGEVRGQINHWLADYRDRLREDGSDQPSRRARMNAANPKYVLRNYLAQLAIDKAESGDYSMVTELLDLLRRPYDEQPEREHFAARRPDWARTRAGCSMLSCSS
ncbi:MAG: protein adenylyltransferase SelO family protein, partial [Gammaproteobacteria bacterium]|nr:protein adenylyltransferase SelO family protein [Gammaproteobacteria bacterium]